MFRNNFKFRIIPDNIQTLTTIYNSRNISISKVNAKCIRYDILDETIEDLLLDCDYNKCFNTCNREQLGLVKYHSLDLDNLEKNYVSLIQSYSKYLKPYRIEFIIQLLKERIHYVRELQFSKKR